jgi:hypothetical protein
MKPAWTSSSGSLPDGFRIRLQRCTFRGDPSSLWKTKVAHYRLPNRRNGPRLAAHARLTQEARRLAGVPAEAFAEFPPAWIERVREGKYWFAGA